MLLKQNPFIKRTGDYIKLNNEKENFKKKTRFIWNVIRMEECYIHPMWILEEQSYIKYKNSCLYAPFIHRQSFTPALAVSK